MSEKTEQPTARQLRKARQRGDVPVSGALSQALAFVAALAVLPAAGRALLGTSADLLVSALDGRTLSTSELCAVALTLSLPLIAATAAAAAALSFAQTGGLWSFERIRPDFARLDLIAGLRSLVSSTRLLSVARALLGALLVLGAVLHVLKKTLPALSHTPGELGAALALSTSSALRLAWYSAALALFLGAVDFALNRRAWLSRWKMTRDEVRLEFRESEGDPELKAARKRAHQEMLVSAAIHAVRDASVVIVNPTHLATALRYREGEDGAPLVLAQGQGELAQRIAQAAHDYGVPIVRDIPIARLLQELEVGQEIPEALYEAVAEILREVWQTEGAGGDDELTP